MAWRIISSSGIEAEKALNGDTSPETVRLLTKEKLQQYLTPMWRQTTQYEIENNDLVIFMSQTVYEQAKEMFEIHEDKVRVWSIPDVDGICPQIKKKVDEHVGHEF